MKAKGNALRIVGGRWRGRRLSFPDAEALRPTGDRIRETLFNWLQPYLSGSRCLDLFAGSGALGLEALSRGAASAVLVEKARAVARQLEQSVRELDAVGARIVNADALGFLAGAAEPFDIVFLDPPFATDLLDRCCGMLTGSGWLAPGAFVYLERDLSQGPPALPPQWTLHREGRAGQVGYYLARS